MQEVTLKRQDNKKSKEENSVNERNREINDFIEKYSDVLKALGMDVAHSKFEDRWFVFKYSATFVSGYDFFIEINSTQQLVNCIISELRYEMYVEIGEEDVDTPECEENNISEMIEQYDKKDSKLVKTLEELVLIKQ